MLNYLLCSLHNHFLLDKTPKQLFVPGMKTKGKIHKITIKQGEKEIKSEK